jgi:hypothetical protein
MPHRGTVQALDVMIVPCSSVQQPGWLSADIGKGWTAWGTLDYERGSQDFSNTTARLGAKYTW